jgi:hypothetical protein
MKHLKHVSETLVKTSKKHLNTVATHTQHLNKTLTSYVWNICNIQINTLRLQNTSEKTDKTLGTDICNMRVQPLQHIQHLNLLLQHPYETLATYL